jgi:hypothetical protein
MHRRLDILEFSWQEKGCEKSRNLSGQMGTTHWAVSLIERLVFDNRWSLSLLPGICRLRWYFSSFLSTFLV